MKFVGKQKEFIEQQKDTFFSTYKKLKQYLGKALEEIKDD
jgi:hypothetical protein